MKLSISIVSCCLWVATTSSFAVADEPAPLFNGESFAGWEGNLDWFRVQDKAIVAGSLERKIPNNEFLCTEQEFENFELTLEAKLVGEGKNAGVQFRSQRIPEHHEVIGYQCDMGFANDRPIWGALYDESRRREFLAEGNIEKLKKAIEGKVWIQLKIRAQGDHIQIWVENLKTVDYREKDNKIPRSGIIGLQIHAGPKAEAWYRNIQLKKL